MLNSLDIIKSNNNTCDEHSLHLISVRMNLKYISNEGIQNSCNHWGGCGDREKMSTKSIQNVCITSMKMDWRHLDSYL